jgi:tetratricopeptide (TPR) repeat protein
VQLAKEYRIETLPTIAFVSPQGRLLYRVNGFQNGEQFASVIDHAQKKAADVLAWEALLESNPNDAFAHAKLGGHMFDVEFYEDALSLLSKAAAADKDRPPKERKRTRTLLGIILHFDNKPAEAEAALNEAIALSPADADEDPAALFTLAKVQMKTERNQEARTNLVKLIDKFPESKPAARAREALETLPAK